VPDTNHFVGKLLGDFLDPLREIFQSLRA